MLIHYMRIRADGTYERIPSTADQSSAEGYARVLPLQQQLSAGHGTDLEERLTKHYPSFPQRIRHGARNAIIGLQLLLAGVQVGMLKVQQDALETKLSAYAPPPAVKVEKPKQPSLPFFPEVPILMYHGIREHPDSTDERYWIRASSLRRQLEWLYDHGYQTLPLDAFYHHDYRALGPGKKPVVITFDDAWESQFRMVKRKDSLSIDPDCAVGILNAFAEKHPGFGNHATFFISFDKTVFGQESLIGRKLNYLLDNGYGIGDHTVHHHRLDRMSTKDAIAEIGGAMQRLGRYLGKRISQVQYLAYPYGAAPKDTVIKLLEDGFTYMEKKYRLEGGLLASGRGFGSCFTEGQRYATIRTEIDDNTLPGLMRLYERQEAIENALLKEETYGYRKEEPGTYLAGGSPR